MSLGIVQRIVTATGAISLGIVHRGVTTKIPPNVPTGMTELKGTYKVA